MVVFLVLAAQFESFLNPFIILLAVPLAITGALGSLFIAGVSVNVYSQIGMILLVGLVAKNGILIVEFSNQMRVEGLSIRDAVTEASVARGAFGSPTFFVGDEMFFGKDQVRDVEEEVVRRR